MAVVRDPNIGPAEKNALGLAIDRVNLLARPIAPHSSDFRVVYAGVRRPDRSPIKGEVYSRSDLKDAKERTSLARDFQIVPSKAPTQIFLPSKVIPVTI